MPPRTLTGLFRSLARCGDTVTLPCERYESFNVAVAGSIVMYDRLAKRRRAATEESAQAKSRGRRRLR